MDALAIDEEMVRKKFYNLNVGKSVRPDGVHHRLLKELSNHFCIQLVRLSNIFTYFTISLPFSSHDVLTAISNLLQTTTAREQHSALECRINV